MDWEGMVRGRTKVICGYDNTVLKLDGHDRRSRNDGLLCVCRGVIVLHVRSIVGSVHIVSGLRKGGR